MLTAVFVAVNFVETWIHFDWFDTISIENSGRHDLPCLPQRYLTKYVGGFRHRYVKIGYCTAKFRSTVDSSLRCLWKSSLVTCTSWRRWTRKKQIWVSWFFLIKGTRFDVTNVTGREDGWGEIDGYLSRRSVYRRGKAATLRREEKCRANTQKKKKKKCPNGTKTKGTRGNLEG